MIILNPIRYSQFRMPEDCQFFAAEVFKGMSLCERHYAKLVDDSQSDDVEFRKEGKEIVSHG